MQYRVPLQGGTNDLIRAHALCHHDNEKFEFFCPLNQTAGNASVANRKNKKQSVTGALKLNFSVFILDAEIVVLKGHFLSAMQKDKYNLLFFKISCG